MGQSIKLVNIDLIINCLCHFMDCKKIFLFLALAGNLKVVIAQRVSYQVLSFPNLSHHEAQIELIVADVPTRTAVFRMSRSSPGRYATHEFGKNVYDVMAFDQNNSNK